jgi:antitoxin component YwqK of YwqJK toxin-antitoxin module
LKKISLFFPLTTFCFLLLACNHVLGQEQETEHPAHGPYEKKYDNGRLKLKGSYRKGKAVGLWQFWRENGKLAIIKNYDKKGKLQGESISFNEKGDTVQAAFYKENQMDGLWRTFANGKPYEYLTYVAGVPEGPAERFYSNGKPSMSSWYKAGLLDGPYTSWDKSGMKLSQGQYLRGKQYGEWLDWSYDGKLESRINYDSSAKKHGLWTEYFSNGKTSSETVYQHGIKISRIGYDILLGFKYYEEHFATDRNGKAGKGLAKYWYSNGKPKQELPYLDNKKNGLAKNWYPNGRLQWEIPYIRDTVNGIENIYDTSGNLIYTAAYLSGMKEGVEIIRNADGSRTENHYHQDRQDGISISYFKNGNKKSEVNYSGGRRTGIYTEWTASGKKIKEEPVPVESIDVSSMGEADANPAFPEKQSANTPASPPTLAGDIYYEHADVQPEFQGGGTALKRFINDNMHYPAAALENNTQGEVALVLYITENGQIAKIEPTRTLNSGCTEEAIRIMKLSSGLWQPGQIKGVQVKTKTVEFVKFRIEN